MGERKVLNRYVPPDFDPSIIPRFKRDKNRVMEVRMMLPFSMRCTTCGEYMGRGKKFNSRKEDCKGEDYMGIRRFRFIVKCSVCSAEISFKTDPKNSDYECEYGATRNYEMWTENATILSEEERVRAEEEETDAMKSLENRTLDSKIEMDVLDALDEIKAINQRHERIDTDHLLDSIRAKALAEKEANQKNFISADEELVKSVQFASQQPKRLADSDSEDDNSAPAAAAKASQPVNLRAAISSQLAAAKPPTVGAGGGVTVIKKKRRVPAPSSSGEGNASGSTGDAADGVPKKHRPSAGSVNPDVPAIEQCQRNSGGGTGESQNGTSTSGSGVGGLMGGLLAGYGDSSEEEN